MKLTPRFLQVMYELPVALRNRFHLYLNVLPIVDSLTFYGLFIGGVGLLIFAITKVSFNLSSSLSSSHHVSKKYGSGLGNQYHKNVYMPCEEKLIPANTVKCPSSYLTDKNVTEMHEIDVKGINYELENELPLIEDNESEEDVSSEETSETHLQRENKVGDHRLFQHGIGFT